MKYTFQLPDFPAVNFELTTSIWTGKSKLKKDNVAIEQSKEKGKPFLIPSTNGAIVKAFPKPSFPDMVPTLEINGVKNLIVEKLKWFQYVLGGLPFLLLFIGGAIGGIIGALATITNFNTLRQEGSEASKYMKVIGIIVASYVLYLTLATFISGLIN